MAKEKPSSVDRAFVTKFLQERTRNMSVASIFSSSFANVPQLTSSTIKQFQQDFQQLGQDLQSGNLTAAESDFTTLQQLQSPSISASTSQSSNPIAQAFNQLAQDLKSGNLSAAQQDFSTLQQDIQNGAQSSQGAHHHHHHGGGGGSEITQLFSQLGQDLQSGNLSQAQQAYTSLQQDFEQFGGSNTSSGATSFSSGVSLTA